MGNKIKLKQIKSNTWKIGTKHKTCWNCKHIRIENFPYRTCPKHPKEFIWSGPDAENEAFEEHDSGKETETTVADDCSDYEFDQERKDKYGEKDYYGE